ncbi:universal stress protein [bacterium]|nr:universal stress protein [bacterium]
MEAIEKIICPVDFSEPSKIALKEANALALQYSAELLVVHIVEPILTLYGKIEPGSVDVPVYEEERRKIAEKMLHDLVEEKVSKKLKVTAILETGDPVDEIIRIVEDEAADIIVIATHGRKGFSHFVFGSVTEKIIRLAPCPLLVIRAPQE